MPPPQKKKKNQKKNEKQQKAENFDKNNHKTKNIPLPTFFFRTRYLHPPGTRISNGGASWAPRWRRSDGGFERLDESIRMRDSLHRGGVSGRSRHQIHLHSQLFHHQNRGGRSHFARRDKPKVKEENRPCLYYLPKKNLPAHFEQLLFNDSSDFKKIGDQIEALQISELVVQTASL